MSMINIIDICESNSIKKLFNFVGEVYDIIKILIPIIIIILGSVDLIKALISGTDETKKYQNLFIKRLITAMCIFFIFPIVSYLMNLLGTNFNNPCMLCFSNPKNKELCDFTDTKTKIEISDNNTNLECSNSNDKNLCCKNKFGVNDSDGIWIWNDDVGCINTTAK